MRRFKKNIILSSLSFAVAIGVLIPVLITSGTSSSDTTNADVAYTLTFNKDENHHNYSYSPYQNKITAKDYLDDDISFKYSRFNTYADGFAVMNPESVFYNPYISSAKHYNGLYGLKSIVIYYADTDGFLNVSYGIDDSYVSSGTLESGKAFVFDGYYPTHFKITASPGESSPNFAVKILSMVINYSIYEYYTEGEEQYQKTELGTKYGLQSIAAGSSYTYTLPSYNIGTQNYLLMKYSTTGMVKGKIGYTYNSTTYYEDFFLERNAKEFRTFLDYFRKGAKGAFAKTLTSITIINPNKTAVRFSLDALTIADRIFSRTDVKYLQDSNIKIGVSLSHGGSLTSVQSMKYTYSEYIDKSYNVHIRETSKYSSSDVYKVVETTPNLINIFDQGREVQQSYYYNVDEINGYTRGTYLESSAMYNPVQAGDSTYNESKIVDYFATDKKIWVKTQALDWAKSNELSKSYMYNTYEIKDGLLRVSNSFINWYGFTNYEENLPTTDYSSQTEYRSLQELPAVYVPHPLNYYSTYFDGYEIYDQNQGWNTGTTAINKIADMSIVDNGDGTYRAGITANSYHYEIRKHAQDWLGYLNEDKFGVAIYMPANKYYTDSLPRHVYVSGNYASSHNVSDKSNRTYIGSDGKSTTPTSTSFRWNPVASSKISNNNYLTTILGCYPTEYQTVSWSYALGADYISNLKLKFLSLKSNNEIYNDFTVWKGALI